MTTSAVCVRAVLDIAAEVEAAEAAIKQALFRAAEARDLDRVLDILRRWQTLPATEVLSMRKDRPKLPHGLEPHGGSEVGVAPDPGSATNPGRRS